MFDKFVYEDMKNLAGFSSEKRPGMSLINLYSGGADRLPSGLSVMDNVRVWKW